MVSQMVLHISKEYTLKQVQDEFSREYPFLRIEFYLNTEPGFAKRHLKSSMPLKAAGLRQNGELEINDLVKVAQLENAFRDQFGLLVQVSRRSGPIWLETTMTDDWTLKQQNDHGRELSEPVNKKPAVKDDGMDED